MMKKAKRLGLGLAASMLATLMLAGCGNSAQPSPGGEQVLNWPLPDNPPSLDAQLATDVVSFDLLNDLQEGLTRWHWDDQNKKIIIDPGIAKSWDISADKKTYTFHLRDAKWSNGDPVTAQDFKDGWMRVLNPDTGAQYAYIFYMIKGAEEYNTKQGPASGVGIQVIDPHTLQVTLKYPAPYFLDLVGYTPYMPLDKKFYDKVGKKYADGPQDLVYDGPFMLTEYQHDKDLTIEKNPNYWNAGQIRLQKVHFLVLKELSTELNLFNTGKLDDSRLNAKYIDVYKDKPGFGTAYMDAVFYIDFNPDYKDPATGVKIFSNPYIRRAFSEALDRAAFVKAVLNDGSSPATGQVPPTIPGNPNKPGDFRTQNGALVKDNDPAAAKADLQRGLQELHISKLPQIQLLSEDGDLARNEDQVVAAAWKKNLGVDVQINAVPFKTRIDKVNHKDYQMVFDGWGADYNDPMTFLDMFETGNAENPVNYSNRQYDHLIDAARLETDPAKRMDDLEQAEKILMNDMPVAPVYFQARSYIQKPYVHGVVRFPVGPDLDFYSAYVQK
jgi:oligopeptide transport system substrate-binding protein